MLPAARRNAGSRRSSVQLARLATRSRARRPAARKAIASVGAAPSWPPRARAVAARSTTPAFPSTPNRSLPDSSKNVTSFTAPPSSAHTGVKVMSMESRGVRIDGSDHRPNAAFSQSRTVQRGDQLLLAPGHGDGAVVAGEVAWLAVALPARRLVERGIVVVHCHAHAALGRRNDGVGRVPQVSRTRAGEIVAVEVAREHQQSIEPRAAAVPAHASLDPIGWGPVAVGEQHVATAQLHQI